MKCGLIGSGHVAHAFGSWMQEQVGLIGQWNRALIPAVPGVPIQRDMEGWEVALLAVSDDALETVSSSLPSGVWRVHFSGAKPLEAMISGGERGAVIWPIASIRKEKAPQWESVHWAVEASDDEVLSWALDTIAALKGTAHVVDGNQRLNAHIAAVFAANFANAVLAESAELVVQVGLPWEAFHALHLGVAERAETVEGALLQTGPASRGDELTLSAHRLALANDPELLRLYNELTDRIQKRSTAHS